jgi:hypothetical protein
VKLERVFGLYKEISSKKLGVTLTENCSSVQSIE